MWTNRFDNPINHSPDDTWHNTHLSSYSTLSGALEPALAQPCYSVRPTATGHTDGIPISTYLRARPPSNAALSAALGPACTQPQHHKRPQGTPSDGIHISSHSPPYKPLDHEGSSIVHLQYPYPERNVVHPAKCIPITSKKMSSKTVIPPGYHQLLQPACMDKEGARRASLSRIGSDYLPIKFIRQGGGAPFCVDELINTTHILEVEGRFDEVFKHVGDRYIKVILTWPGYSKFPVERRVCTENGTLTRDKLLIILATHIEEFMHHVHRKDIPVEKGYEKYELLWRPSGLATIWRECLITSLVHRLGSTWQAELYVKM